MNSEFRCILLELKFVVFDFDGVFTDNKVWVFDDGREAVCCSRADGIGLSRLRELGIDVAILSTETNPVVGARARKLRVDCIQGCPDKRLELKSMADKRGISLSHTAYVGNDLNDLAALAIAGCPIAIVGSPNEVISSSIWTTTRAGGDGAVREVCDLIADTQKAGMVDPDGANAT